MMKTIKQTIRAVDLRLRFFLLQFIMRGSEIMMAMFFAQRVILGKTAYKDVPAALKAQVKEILEDSGLGELVIED